MLFYPEDQVVPEKLEADPFLIRPLRATDVELDYQAVIASRENLLMRTGGRWPKVGFTIEENLSDLEYHEAQHDARNEFTYTVLNMEASECLGCIYIYPLEKSLKDSITEEDLASLKIKDYEAYMTCWVIPAAIEQGWDKRLLEVLREWFAEDWAFTKVVLSFGAAVSPRDLTIPEEIGLPRRFSFETAKGIVIGWQLK
ncbi:MAG: hypothetical protein ACE5OZ_21870 [Candidatus Heimdallarchaeota archaeon]